MRWLLVVALTAMVGLAVAPGCDDGGDGDADADTDGDADGDSDGDTDGDSDGDPDGDGEGDADGDGEGDADGDGEGDADVAFDADADADGDAGSDADVDSCASAACGSSDGCCPEGCAAGDDADCCDRQPCDLGTGDGCCPTSCGALDDVDCPSICGDGRCTGDEDVTSCPADCALCPDGLCTGDEDAASCPDDCPAECGDGLCTHDETACSCASDCDLCGDGECSSTEAGAGTCAADCPGVSHAVRICAGTFTMGSPAGEAGYRSDETEHEVTLTTDFEIWSTEVTQDEFAAVMGYGPSYSSACGGSCPVEQVSWHEAAAYCNALSIGAGLTACYDCIGVDAGVTCGPAAAYATPYDCPGYRLPTEAEWEHAARAGTTTASYNGDLDVDPLGCDASAVLDPIAWWCGNSGWMTSSVGTRVRNGWGLHDMLGNVWEWEHDWYADYPGPVTDPWGPGTGSGRVLRGGSWNDFARGARAANRGWFDPDLRSSAFGFRVARSRP